MIQLRPEKARQEQGARGEETVQRDHSWGLEARRLGGGGGNEQRRKRGVKHT
jgi:hypothetical protein